MGTLTTELRREHSLLVSRLSALARADASQPEVQQQLREVHLALRAHLDRETREIYGPLETAALTQRNLAMTLRLFGDSTANLTERALGFFDRYSSGAGGPEYPQACAQALQDLRERVRREETLLFPEFDRSPRR